MTYLKNICTCQYSSDPLAPASCPEHGGNQWIIDTVFDAFEARPYYRNRQLPPILFQLAEQFAQSAESLDESQAKTQLSSPHGLQR